MDERNFSPIYSKRIFKGSPIVKKAKNTSLVVSSLFTTVLIASHSASALDIRGVEVGIQPRIETGLLYYEYSQDATTATVLSTSQVPGLNISQEKFSFKDTMPFASGGLTVFADRFFLDLSALTTLSDGNDSDQVSYSNFIEGTTDVFDTAFTSVESDFNADFDRDEYAISLGYGVTEQLAVFGGYKWAKTDFKTKGRGPGGILFTPGIFPPEFGFPTDRTNGNGVFEAETDFDFEYDGPFVGINYGLEVNAGLLEGTLSFNFAAAFLDGKSKVKNDRQTLTITEIDGVPVNPILLDQLGGIAPTVSVESEGETVGLTFGIGWRGFTPIENLTYAVNVSGYKYEFDADNQGGALEDPDIDETALAFRVGLGYAF